MKKTVLLLLFAIAATCAQGNASSRWSLNADGSIVWRVGANLPHYDHLEMSGEKVSAVIRYGVNSDSSFYVEKSLVWPMLRTIPNDTHGSLMRRFAFDAMKAVQVNGKPVQHECVDSLVLDGRLRVYSHASGVRIVRCYFPSATLPMLCENYEIENAGKESAEVVVPAMDITYKTDAAKGVNGSYCMNITGAGGEGIHALAAGESVSFSTCIEGLGNGETLGTVNVAAEEQKRMERVSELWSKLVVETPDAAINAAFAFAKVRAAESIFRTKNGLMHGPGGEAYYAAIWANDQAEYVNPLFPFLGYALGNESALTSFDMFAGYMNDEYRPIPSSIVAEGTSYWNGAGDRGDAAMIAYGASRYALACGDAKVARHLMPLITWCLEYCKRKLNADGVVASDHDELEGRFPAGDANLCTSSLYYDALLSAACLSASLGEPRQEALRYRSEAAQLRANIDRHFGANVEGYDTYRYYKGNDILRSWICIPLTMGILDRKKATIDALFSPRLWTRDGMLTQAGSGTYWDRTTLYALRGAYAAGYRDLATGHLQYYTAQRLLGEHVPYPIEAWPEGSQRHLSAESGLYCRVITEGLFGMRPTGLRQCEITPQLPEGWNRMALRNVQAFGSAGFDIVVERKGEKVEVTLLEAGKKKNSRRVGNGETLTLKL